MESHGYDDNTLSPGRPMNKPYQPANGGYHSMVQGHSNPAMNVEGMCYSNSAMNVEGTSYSKLLNLFEKIARLKF
jgi:hypothetical protein